MNWLQRLWNRGRLEDQLAKELRFHREQQEADLIARGLEPRGRGGRRDWLSAGRSR